ncbi:protein adenylyltransferase SelO [Sporolactobacillus spathodeae]|uniref:Protein nucleotidyltransferase YdiU n=1 Tax=Sporolactobacillus spathodeae TaxID=1465502 RepID=A0ABS2QBN1_9BACL|nr:YdiU family protein [Sporolactobacillus spathodeae]MBM7659143.1 uncharacterized protein YdiU (UPF0061 family) [Sporolactobacillus spathodeae]
MTQNKETGWNFDNSYADLPESFFSNVMPTPVRAPKLAILNQPLASFLGLDVQQLQSETNVAVFAGNRIPEGAAPLAQAYAGHQFGHFTLLGDGRAVLLGEQLTPKGERFDIQLKGSGPTPYSRGGDGRAALGPMLREYVISEAMHALGIPTTRILAVVTTGESVVRETDLPGAVLTRVAASHLRVGTFQYVAAWGTEEELQILADYTIQRHFPYIELNANRYRTLLEEVIKRQAALIANWQLVGFIHGVMNTDNMAISGETIDYGPCAFMDAYDPATVFSSIDRRGRYAYGNQPDIAGWNLARFAESLLPLLGENQEQAVAFAQDKVFHFGSLYQVNWLSGMRSKLGLFHEAEQDEALINRLLTLMKTYHADYTNTFRALTLNDLENDDLFKSREFAAWQRDWQARLDGQEESRETATQLMRKSNPAIIPRNHRVEEALAAAVDKGDYSVLERLLAVLSQPYAYSNEQVAYAKLPVATACYQTFCGT